MNGQFVAASGSRMPRRPPSSSSGSTTSCVLPVVDSKGVPRGVMTVDDVLDVQEETATHEARPGWVACKPSTSPSIGHPRRSPRT